MTCKHKRLADVYMKHNDLASFQVNHLDLTLDGYMPSLGIFSGDDTSFSVCLDCGQITDWVKITDEMINKQCAEQIEEHAEEAAARLARNEGRRAADVPAVIIEDPGFNKSLIELQAALITSYGDIWWGDADALALVVNLTREGRDKYVRYAAKKMLTKVAT